LLAVVAQHTNKGIGRRLIAAAEGWAIDNGINEMQLELLAPATWEHPAKVALKKWYSRLGYSPRDNKSFNDLYPGPATFLTTACDFTLWSKALKVGDQVNDAA
jgi:predicted N-acetyltransferase YhbS